MLQSYSNLDLISNVSLIYLILIGVAELNSLNIRMKDEDEERYYLLDQSEVRYAAFKNNKYRC